MKPGDADPANPDQGDNCGRQRKSVAAHRSRKNIEETVDELQPRHIVNANDAEGDDRRVATEKSQQRLRQENGHQRQSDHEHASHLERRTRDSEAAFYVPRAIVDADKSRHRLPEGVHKAVHIELNGQRCRGGGHRVGAQPIDCRLYEDIGEREHHALRSCGKPNAYDTNKFRRRQPELSQSEPNLHSAACEKTPQNQRVHDVSDNRRPHDAGEAQSQMYRY